MFPHTHVHTLTHMYSHLLTLTPTIMRSCSAMGKRGPDYQMSDKFSWKKSGRFLRVTLRLPLS